METLRLNENHQLECFAHARNDGLSSLTLAMTVYAPRNDGYVARTLILIFTDSNQMRFVCAVMRPVEASA
jgi:hypothetical protein